MCVYVYVCMYWKEGKTHVIV